MGTRSLSTPLPMVAEPARNRATDPYYVLPSSDKRMKGRTISNWSPRSEPTQAKRWEAEVREAMRTSTPSIPLIVLDGPPTAEELVTKYRQATNEERAEAFAAAMAEYQAYNTWLWDLIDEGIDTKGAYQDVDAVARDRFKVDELRDGVGLRQWALGLAERDPIAAQMQAIEKLGSYPKLSAADGTTVVQLDLHTHGLLRAWMAVDGNDPVQRFGHFRAQFLATLPDQPVTSKVVVVRQHLYPRPT